MIGNNENTTIKCIKKRAYEKVSFECNIYWSCGPCPTYISPSPSLSTQFRTKTPGIVNQLSFHLSKKHGSKGQSSGPDHGQDAHTSAVIILGGGIGLGGGALALLAVVIGTSLGSVLAVVVKVIELLNLEVLDLLAVGAHDLEVEGEVLDVDKLALGLGVDAVVNELLGTGGNIRDGEVGVEALGLDELLVAGEESTLLSGRLLGVQLLPVDLGVGSLEAVVVDKQVSLVILKLDETVVVLLLSVLVDNATREGVLHVRAVDGLSLGPVALVVVAAVLAEEDGNSSVLETVLEIAKAGRLEGGVLAAPGVRVEREEVGTAHVILVAILGASDEVVGVPKNLANIGGRVADGDLTVNVVLDVVLEVTRDGTQVRRDVLGGRDIVNDLVGGVEEESVGESAEGLDNSEGAVQVLHVVRLPGVVRGDGLTREGRVDVKHHVHAGGVEDAGALVVVDIRRQVVDANGVDAKNLQDSGITLANLGVAEGILALLRGVPSATTGLVSSTNNLELVAVLVNKVGTLELEGFDRSSDRGHESHEGRRLLFDCISTLNVSTNQGQGRGEA